jgi:hypothetical protein
MVIAPMAALAHRFHMGFVATARLMAVMRYRETNPAAHPLRRLPVPLHAATWTRMGAMQATLTGALALALSQLQPDIMRNLSWAGKAGDSSASEASCASFTEVFRSLA